MNRRELRNLGGVRLVANAAQLSIRDLRMRPLRAMPEAKVALPFESPLENALAAYLNALPDVTVED